jgi:hypothetical protein
MHFIYTYQTIISVFYTNDSTITILHMQEIISKFC